MSTIDAICAKLETMYSHRGDGIPTQYVNADGPEASALIRQQAAEIERLKERLIIAHEALDYNP